LTEKSEDNAAYIPSFPSIPIPIFEHYIIPTSFPPSPIQQTIFLHFSLIYEAIYDFY